MMQVKHFDILEQSTIQLLELMIYPATHVRQAVEEVHVLQGLTQLEHKDELTA